MTRALSRELFRLFQQQAPKLRVYLRRRVQEPADAEELFQELCLVVIGHQSGPKSLDRFPEWCRALARHMLAHHFRSKRRRERLLERVELEGIALCQRIDPERLASARELLDKLVVRLDPESTELLSQRYALGESAQEIARRLEQSPAAVRMRLMRLRSAAKGQFRSRPRSDRPPAGAVQALITPDEAAAAVSQVPKTKAHRLGPRAGPSR